MTKIKLGNEKILNAILILLFALSSIAFYFVLDLSFSKVLYGALLILPVMFLAILLLRIRSKMPWVKKYTFFILGCFLLILVVLSGLRHNYVKKNLIDNTGGIITIGIVDEIVKSNSVRDIVVIYSVDGKTKKRNFRCSRESLEKIKISDTVLVISSVKNPEVSFLHKLFPTSKEIAKFKNGCYYIDGHLVDSIE